MQAVRPPAVQDGGDAGMSTEPKRLLLVDDSGLLAFCYAEYLASHGFAVDTAASAADALRALRVRGADLVILDIAVGANAGVGFLKHLLGADGKLACPVVVHTQRPEMEEFCRAIGVDAFLLKDGNGLPLRAAIEAVFARRAPTVAAESPRAEASAQAYRGRVLLAEDDPDIADAIRRAFALKGLTVEVVADGTAVTARAAEQPFEAIVTKEVLSGLNGRAVAQQLSQAPSLRQLPVVLYDKTRGLDELVRWQKLPRNVKAVLLTDEPARLLDAVLEHARLPPADGR
jgi:DNA-binding response OmpR family regulator